MSGSRGWAARAEGHPVQPPTQGAQMGTGEVAALQARASDVDVRGRWSPLLGTLSGSGGGNVPILYCPPGSYQMPVQVAVSSCVASCPELQLPHTTTYFLPLRAPGVSLVDGVLGQILWVRRGEDYLLCARSPSSAKPQLPGARCTCGRTWARASQSCGGGTLWRLLWGLHVSTWGWAQLCACLGCQQTPRAKCGHAFLKTSMHCAAALL